MTNEKLGSRRSAPRCSRQRGTNASEVHAGLPTYVPRRVHARPCDGSGYGDDHGFGHGRCRALDLLARALRRFAHPPVCVPPREREERAYTPCARRGSPLTGIQRLPPIAYAGPSGAPLAPDRRPERPTIGQAVLRRAPDRIPDDLPVTTIPTDRSIRVKAGRPDQPRPAQPIATTRSNPATALLLVGRPSSHDVWSAAWVALRVRLVGRLLEASSSLERANVAAP